ncbi:MAG: hypothetical protein CMD26_02710 [Flavobacteriales bacterium]|nr:hypothetical protein [Flavobacteriales bacterium]
MQTIRFINNKFIDKNKWDNCISHAFNCRIYGFSWYLDIVCKNWEGVVYGDYELVFPVVYKKVFFLKFIYHPFFCQQLGPFCSQSNLENNQKAVFLILESICNRYSRFDCAITFSMSTIIKSIVDTQKLPLKIIDRVNLELDLKNSYNNLISCYSYNHKRNLKSDISSYSWDIRKITTEDEGYINEFLSLHKNYISVKAGLKSQNYQVIKTLILSCAKKNIGLLIGLRNNASKLVSCAFFVSDHHKDILLFNASANEQKINHMIFIIDRYIKMNASKSRYLDFEGSNLPGLKRLYSGFGAVEKNYIHMKK